MTDEIKYLIKNPKHATLRVEEFIGVYTKSEIAELLEVSRPVLYDRLKLHNWKLAELQKITEHFPVLV